MVWFVIGVYKIDRTLHGRLKIWNIFSYAGEYFSHSLCLLVKYFSQHSKRHFVSPRGQVISSIYYSFKILAAIPRLIHHNQVALSIFGRRKQHTIYSMVSIRAAGVEGGGGGIRPVPLTFWAKNVKKRRPPLYRRKYYIFSYGSHIGLHKFHNLHCHSNLTSNFEWTLGGRTPVPFFLSSGTACL